MPVPVFLPHFFNNSYKRSCIICASRGNEILSIKKKIYEGSIWKLQLLTNWRTVSKLANLSCIAKKKLSSRVQANKGNKTCFYKLLKSWESTPSTLCLSVDCLLLAVDQQYGFPVSASQRASVTVTLPRSSPSDSTPWPESGPDEWLILQPDLS